MKNYRNKQQMLKIGSIMSMNLIGTHLVMQIMQIGIQIEIVRPIVGLTSGALYIGSPTTRRRSAEPATKVLKDRKMGHNKITDLTNIVGIIE